MCNMRCFEGTQFVNPYLHNNLSTIYMNSMKFWNACGSNFASFRNKLRIVRSTENMQEPVNTQTLEHVEIFNT